MSQKEIDAHAHSLNKSKLAKKLQERFSGRDGKSKKLTLTQATDIIDAIFGVASRDGSERSKKDGILAEHLLQEMTTKTVIPNANKKLKYTDLNYNKVTIPGFGTFSVAYRVGRKGTHPDPDKDGSIKIPETFVITFRPGKSLKAAIKVTPKSRSKSNKSLKAALKQAREAHKKKESIRKQKSSDKKVSVKKKKKGKKSKK
ncbi:MAG: HU family DNA-binding protein [Myxococcota bacterium]|nr:HU family DNA-binding protein [Myxococcota bacterium]